MWSYPPKNDTAKRKENKKPLKEPTNSPTHRYNNSSTLPPEMKGQWFSLKIGESQQIQIQIKSRAITQSRNALLPVGEAWQNGLLRVYNSMLAYDTGAMFNSSGLKAPWTISWTVRLRRQTSDNSSTGTAKELISAPDAASDNAFRNLERSTSVTAVCGISETLSLTHSTAWARYARVSANRVYVTWRKM